MRTKSKNIGITLILSGMIIFLCQALLFAQPIKMKAGMGMAYAKGYRPVEKFVKAIEKATEGRIVIQDFQPGEHPFKPGDIMKAVRNGIMQIGFTTSLYTQGIMPKMGVQDLPFLFDTPEEFLAMMDDPEFADVKKFILDDPLQKWNQTPIAWFAYGGYMFAGPKWIDDFDSWEGLRIRVYSKPMAQMIKLFGAVPVNVTWAEVYTALQRKMIDGFLTATAGAYPAKLYESTKWVTLNDYSVGLHFLTINNKVLKSLPADLREQFLEACRVNAKILQDDYFLEDARAIKMSMKTNGVRFKAMDPALKKATREKMYSQWMTWADKYSYGGETARIIERINEYHELYVNRKR